MQGHVSKGSTQRLTGCEEVGYLDARVAVKGRGKVIRRSRKVDTEASRTLKQGRAYKNCKKNMSIDRKRMSQLFKNG